MPSAGAWRVKATRHPLPQNDVGFHRPLTQTCGYRYLRASLIVQTRTEADMSEEYYIEVCEEMLGIIAAYAEMSAEKTGRANFAERVMAAISDEVLMMARGEACAKARI